MSSRDNIDNHDWSEMVGRSLRDAESMPSDELWGKIEGSLAEETRGRVISPLWGAVAAAAVVVVLASTLFLSEVGDKESGTVDFVEIAQSDDVVQSDPPVIEEEVVISQMQPSTNVIISSNDGDEEDIYEVEPDTDDKPVQEEIKEEVEESKPATDVVTPKRVESRIPHISTQQHRPKTVLAMNIGGGSAQSNSSNPAFMPTDLLSADCHRKLSFEETYEASDISHRQPFSLEVSVGRSLNDHINLVSGISYSMFASNVELLGESESVDQRLHFIGVPLRVELPLWSSDRLMFYAGAGGQVEYCLVAKVGRESYDERKWHFSLDGVVGAQYKLLDGIAIYAEPDISYYINKTRLRTVRNDSPVTFSMRFGVRFVL